MIEDELKRIEDEIKRTYINPHEDYKRCIGICNDFCCNFDKGIVVLCDGSEKEISVCHFKQRVVSENRRVVVR